MAGYCFTATWSDASPSSELGIDHPNSAVIGTWLAPGNGDAERGRRLVGSDRPYLVYSGRRCREKNTPLLIDWLKRFEAEFPQRFCFAFTGDSVALPAGPDWKNLGYLSEAAKADALAGAAALVQLSINESLSLVALEAWRDGVPVIAHADCDVLADLVGRSDGGVVVGDYGRFRDALTDLWQRLPPWDKAGRRGQEFVQDQYGSPEIFVGRLSGVLANLDRPLAELMRVRGRQAAAARTDTAWQLAFAERVDCVLHAETPACTMAAVVAPRKGASIGVGPGRRARVRLTNTGTVPLWPDGPHAVWLRCTISDDAIVARLPQLVRPGQSISLSVRLPEFDPSAECQAEFALVRGDESISVGAIAASVDESSRTAGGTADDMLFAELSTRLAAAEALAELPTGYEDVTEGRLATWKRAVKQKLLHQFRTSYVDVLSRQQTAMNRVLLSAIQELAECAALLGQPAAPPASATAEELARGVSRLKDQVRRTVKRIDTLECRLDALEESSRIRDASEMS